MRRWLTQDPALDKMSDQRRQELIQLGYPDDGYDYLKHLRAGGRGGTAQLTGESRVRGKSIGLEPVGPCAHNASHGQLLAETLGYMDT